VNCNYVVARTAEKLKGQNNMSALCIYDETGQPTGSVTTDIGLIAEQLAKHGVQFERWPTIEDLPDDADQDTVINAYQKCIDVLNKTYNFKSVDVVALRPDNPQKDNFRQKFLSEHTHADFEVRFFVDGSGLFYLHLDNKVYLVLCQKGDLISVPAKTTHWFDMGENPDFKCIRLFTTEEGWLGEFTGSDIASRLPCMNTFVTGLS
jgi:1,2-dihydroxy-3-keto-5-methylthiopentene dioxygenase